MAVVTISDFVELYNKKYSNITVVAENSKREVTTDMYLLRKMLYQIIAIDTNSKIAVTVKEENFDKIKNYVTQ